MQGYWNEQGGLLFRYPLLQLCQAEPEYHNWITDAILPPRAIAFAVGMVQNTGFGGLSPFSECFPSRENGLAKGKGCSLGMN